MACLDFIGGMYFQKSIKLAEELFLAKNVCMSNKFNFFFVNDSVL